MGALACRGAIQLKHAISVDDALDVLAIHGVGGLVGTLMTGIFAQNSITVLDGISSIPGGWVDGVWIQVVWQGAGCLATILWSVGVTFMILFVMNKIPGLKLRVNAAAAEAGVDSMQMGERAYDEPAPVVVEQNKPDSRRRSSVVKALHHIKKMTINTE